MRVRILGSAAGGGFPQWNCDCSNCRRLREGTLKGAARTQTQIAVSSRAGCWCLLNASPDLRTQMLSFSELQPRSDAPHFPVSCVVLMGADVDAVLGLLHLREFQPLRIYATQSVRRILNEDNSLFGVLHRNPGQSEWTDMNPGEKFELRMADGGPSGIQCQVFPLTGDFPLYIGEDRRKGCKPGEAVVALRLEETATGRSFVFTPNLPRISPELSPLLKNCDLLMLDGTFWSDDELPRVRPGVPTATAMGHLPLSGPSGSLASLAGVTRPRKILIHVNNTNPVLDEESPEFREVSSAGWEVARDGMEISL